jgi:hypothetical protein
MTDATAPVTGHGPNKTSGSMHAKRSLDAAASSEGLPRATPFDYGREAELFPARSRKPRRNPIGYKRFAKASDAVRFAIEELSEDLLLGAYLQVDEERFGSVGIRRLYESADYPLKRRRVLPSRAVPSS